MSTPSTNVTDRWMHSKSHIPKKNPKDTGKWLLFYHSSHIDSVWKYLNELFDEYLLKGVICMKVSTAFSRRGTHHVICLYTCNYRNAKYTIEIGENIVKILENDLPHTRSRYIYYKSDEMTLKGLKGHIYEVKLSW